MRLRPIGSNVPFFHRRFTAVHFLTDGFSRLISSKDGDEAIQFDLMRGGSSKPALRLATFRRVLE
jgi:hypothetical protein